MAGNVEMAPPFEELLPHSLTGLTKYLHPTRSVLT
jgi:hypothetical protein